jgi:hypothetical protein
MTGKHDAILVGGPYDGSPYAADDAGLVELEDDKTIHRYIHTTAHREVNGAELRVYNYDGEVAPHGGRSGVENAEARVASPLADDSSSGT